MDASRTAAAVTPDEPTRSNRVTELIIGDATEVHSAPGPGLLERLDQEALQRKPIDRGVPFRQQVPVNVSRKGHVLGKQFLDRVVDGFRVLELKSVDRVSEVHLSQLTSCMRAGKYPLGLLLNFNTPRLQDGVFRRINTVRTRVPESSPTDSASSP